jgi:RHS repeat-associated protein
VYDATTGNHYNYFRDYDPKLGRYIQADPIGLNGGLNRYGYVGQSPLMYGDPFGLLGGDTVTAYCRQYPVDCIEIFYGPLPDDGCSPVLSAVSEALDNPVIAAAVSIASSKGKGFKKVKAKKPDSNTTNRKPPIDGARYTGSTSNTHQWEKTGGYNQALEDFKNLNPNNVQFRPNGTTTGVLPDGRPINVRPSSDNGGKGPPTLDITNGKNNADKIRYP